MEEALRFVISRSALSFGWNEPYELIVRRDPRLESVPVEDLALVRAVPPDNDCNAPPESWEIVVDYRPDCATQEEVERRCRQAFISIRPVLGLLMRRCSGAPIGR